MNKNHTYMYTICAMFFVLMVNNGALFAATNNDEIHFENINLEKPDPHLIQTLEKLIKLDMDEKEIANLVNITQDDIISIHPFLNEYYTVHLKNNRTLYVGEIGGIVGCVLMIKTKHYGILRIFCPESHFYKIQALHHRHKQQMEQEHSTPSHALSNTPSKEKTPPINITWNDIKSIEQNKYINYPDEGYTAKLRNGATLYTENIGGIVSCVLTTGIGQQKTRNIHCATEYFYEIRNRYNKLRQQGGQRISAPSRTLSSTLPQGNPPLINTIRNEMTSIQRNTGLESLNELYTIKLRNNRILYVKNIGSNIHCVLMAGTGQQKAIRIDCSLEDFYDIQNMYNKLRQEYASLSRTQPNTPSGTPSSSPMSTPKNTPPSTPRNRMQQG